MKRTLTIMIVILVAAGAILSVISSDSRYASERLLYRALKSGQKLIMNPDVAPPKMLAAVENNFYAVIKKYPKSDIAKAAHLRLAEVYIGAKSYDKAEALLDIIASKYPDDIGMLSTAQYLKGLMYERQGKWERALKEYTILRDKYTTTIYGLQIPLYIARYYVEKGRDDEAARAYSDAVSFYEKIEANYRRKQIGYAAASLLVQAYINAKEFEKAGDAVISCINNYPSPMTLNQMLPYIELIYVRIMKRTDKAIEVYSDLKSKSRDEKLNNFLQKRIDRLKAKPVG